MLPRNSLGLEVLHDNKNEKEEDILSPKIIGANDKTIKIGDEFNISKDAYVIDNSNAPITACDYGYVNTKLKGTYIITYVAIDKN